MKDRSLSAVLASFGLTEKEIDTYMKILEEGDTTVSTVAEGAGVSKRHVYNTVVRLEERGLVEMFDFTTPARLRPVPPERVREIQTDEVDTLYGMLSERYNQVEQDFEPIELIKTKATLVKRFQQLINQADIRITIIVPPSLLLELEDELAGAVERDVFVLLILSGKTIKQIDEYGFEFERLAHAVRVRWDKTATQLTVDRSFGLVSPHTFRSDDTETEQAVAFGQQYIEPVIHGSFLSNEWQFAEEIYTKFVDDLPKSFNDFRYATTQASIHRKYGNELRATITARPVRETGSITQLEGDVVDVRQQIVEPMNGSIVENSLDLKTDDMVVNVGGPRAFIEDYEAISTRLEYRDN